MSRERLKRILALALPVIGGMVSQNVLNLVDTAMVGTLGDAALASVGIASFTVFMSQALILGVGTGVQAMAARRKGEGRMERTAQPLNTGLVLVLLLAPVFTLALYLVAPHLFPLLASDPHVAELGAPYYQVRVLAILFVGMNFAFRGYWNAIDMSRVYMFTLVAMHALNIVLNYILIFGKFGAPALGVYGAGLATTLSLSVGTVIYFVLGFRLARANGFLSLGPDRDSLKTLTRLSLPNGIQQFFFAAGFVAMYWIIGRVGTAELAAANVMINIMLVAILPGIGLGIAAATLVGQALGRGEPLDARQWGWDVTRVGVIGMAVLGLPMWLAPEGVLSLFIHEPATVELARLPMRITGVLIAFEAVGLILMNALLGAGDSKRVMLISIGFQWILFLPLAWLAGPSLGFGLLGIWILQGVYRLGMAATFTRLWQHGRWARIRV